MNKGTESRPGRGQPRLLILAAFCTLGIQATAAAEGDGGTAEPPVQASGDLELAKSLLDEAVKRTAELDDPGWNLGRLAAAAVKLDASFGLTVVREAARILASGKEPRDPVSVHVSLAKLAAPYDKSLRDDLLRTVTQYADKQLRDENRWKADPLPPGRIAFGDTQNDLDNRRGLLELRVSLWSILADGGKDVVERLRALMNTAKSKGGIGGGTIRSKVDFLQAELAALDPALLIEAWPADDKDLLPAFLFREARSRHLDGFRGPFTRQMMMGVVKSGYQNDRIPEYLCHYDMDAAVKMAQATGSLHSVILPLAWTDLDRALTVADNDRELVSEVSRVWARKRPEQIEPLLTHQDNEVRRNWARAQATVELFRRGQRDEAMASPHADWFGFAAASETMPAEERLPFLFKCLKRANANYGNLAILAERIFRVDPDEGMRALDIAMQRSNPKDYCVMTIYISRVSPRGLLKLYRACPDEKKLYATSFFSPLAVADADFAYSEAMKLPEPERYVALGYVAVGIAESDLARARKIVDTLPEQQRHPMDIGEHFLRYHPTRTDEINGEYRQTILNQAAVSSFTQTGNTDAMEKIVDNLEREEADQVLSYFASGVAQKHLHLAAEVARRIHQPQPFDGAAINIADTIRKRRQMPAWESE